MRETFEALAGGSQVPSMGLLGNARGSEVKILTRDPGNGAGSIARGGNGTGEADDPLDTLKRLLDQSARRLVDDDDVWGAMGELFAGLSEIRARTPGHVWGRLCRTLCANHPVAGVLAQDPLTRRGRQKPRGFPGDAKILDMLYCISEAPPETTLLGRKILGYLLGVPTARGVRQRLRLLTEMVKATKRHNQGASIWSIACGHAREADPALKTAVEPGARYLAVDQDAKSVEAVRERLGPVGVTSEVVSVRDLVRSESAAETFQLVYATGLYDYLSDSVGSRLLDVMLDHLTPGGMVFLSNATEHAPDAAYMEAFMDWWLIYRTHEQMLHLISSRAQAQVDRVEVFEDEGGTFHFMLLHKRSR